VLILDYSMPVCSGLEVLAQVRQTRETQYLPVVMHSGQMNPHQIAEAYRLGANAYVEKPFGLNELVGIFKELGVFWGRINVPPPVAMA
jgi:CheY-like chemotaxis protein